MPSDLPNDLPSHLTNHLIGNLPGDGPGSRAACDVSRARGCPPRGRRIRTRVLTLGLMIGVAGLAIGVAGLGVVLGVLVGPLVGPLVHAAPTPGPDPRRDSMYSSLRHVLTAMDLIDQGYSRKTLRERTLESGRFTTLIDELTMSSLCDSTVFEQLREDHPFAPRILYLLPEDSPINPNGLDSAVFITAPGLDWSARAGEAPIGGMVAWSSSTVEILPPREYDELISKLDPGRLLAWPEPPHGPQEPEHAGR